MATVDMDQESVVGSRPEVARHSVRVLGMGARTNRIVAVAGVLALVVLAFSAGRVYQNNQDQNLFNQYNPAAAGGASTGAGGTFRGAGAFGGGSAGGGQSSLARAALGVGSPPGTTSAPAGSAAGAGGGAASSAPSGAAGAAGGARVAGTISAISASSLTVQSFSGSAQTVALTPGTAFYQTKSGTMNDLSPGESVTVVATQSGSSLQATRITVGPAGAVSGGGGFGGGFGGGGFGGVNGGTPPTSVRGTITSVGQNVIDVSGTKGDIAVTSSTRISTLVRARPSAFKSGLFVTVTLSSGSGSQVASTVVERSSTFRGGGFGSGQGATP